MKRVSEQRTANRYTITLDVSFRWSEGDRTCQGAGLTKELSQNSVRLLTDEPMLKGTKMELRISWPVPLQSVYPLELLVRGVVVRSGDGFTVVGVSNYEFRTSGSFSFDQTVCRGASCNMLA
jgi:hypothetical protein